MKYQIIGGDFPAVLCDLNAGESMINESGSMAWMTPNMKMETIGGGVGKIFGRMLSGEAMFQNKYTAQGGVGQISFASSFPGQIKVIEVSPDKPVILQKSAFLAATEGVELSMHFRGKVGAGFFGGEGFIMQKVSGHGIVFVEIDGAAHEYELGAGEAMIVDTGNLATMDATCSIEIQTVPGVKNMLFGGEGIFNTVVKGPGKITLQTMPLSAIASVIYKYMPTSK